MENRKITKNKKGRSIRIRIETIPGVSVSPFVFTDKKGRSIRIRIETLLLRET